MKQKKGINVLSLFDGMSCGQIALNRAGIKVDTYYAAEIDKHAIQITQKNFPNTIQLGDVTRIDTSKLFTGTSKIDLVIGGSPCQGFSFAGKQLNFNDPRSSLFFEFVRILNEVRAINPEVKFLLENVKMKKEFQDVISQQLGVEPIEINSNLVSAQNRRRLYWTNIPGIEKPKDKGILLKDVLEEQADEKYYVSEHRLKQIAAWRSHQNPLNKIFTGEDKAACLLASDFKGFHAGMKLVKTDINGKPKPNQDKASCLTVAGHSGGNHSNMDLLDLGNNRIRRLTPLEYERLQTVPDNYTEGASDTQRYKMMGNGWTVDVIAHIFSLMRQ